MRGPHFNTAVGEALATVFLFAAGNIPAAENEDAWDANEIAARAVASALPDSPEEEHTDLAAEAYDAVVRDLLYRIDSIEKEQGHVARALEAPLFELGKLYLTADRCEDA